MSQSDLLIECPYPSRAQVPAKCGQCLHFKQSAYYTVAGVPTVCSSEPINRRENSVPCPHWAAPFDTYQNMSPAAKASLEGFIASLGLDVAPTELKGPTDCKRRAENLDAVSRVLRVMAEALRKGWVLGGTYLFDSPDGLKEGQLLSFAGGHAVLAVGAVNYTISLDRLQTTA